MLYVDDVDLAASRLGLRPTDAGTNVMLLSPFDDVVFERTWIENGLTLAEPGGCGPVDQSRPRRARRSDSRTTGDEGVTVTDPLYVAAREVLLDALEALG